MSFKSFRRIIKAFKINIKDIVVLFVWKESTTVAQAKKSGMGGRKHWVDKHQYKL